jgi:hypothetical protein
MMVWPRGFEVAFNITISIAYIIASAQTVAQIALNILCYLNRRRFQLRPIGAVLCFPALPNEFFKLGNAHLAE